MKPRLMRQKSLALWMLAGAGLGVAAVFGGQSLLPPSSMAEVALQLSPADPEKPLTADELAGQARIIATDPAAAAAGPFAGLNVTQDATSATITLRITSRDGVLAGGILTRIAETYASRSQPELPEFLALARDVGRHKQVLDETEMELSALRTELSDLQATGAAGELRRQIGSAEQRVDETRFAAAAVRRAIDAGSIAVSTLRPLNTPELAALRAEREGVMADIDSLAADMPGDDPRLLDARFELKRIERRMVELAERVASQLEAGSRTAASRASDLKARLTAMAKAEELEKKQSRLFETIAQARAGLDQSLKKLAAHAAVEGEARFGVRILGPAKVTPIKTAPSRQTFVLAAALGMFAGWFMQRLAARGAPASQVVPVAASAAAPAQLWPAVAPDSRSEEWQNTYATAAMLLAEAHARNGGPQPVLPPPALAPTAAASSPPPAPMMQPQHFTPGEVLGSEVRRIGLWAMALRERPGISLYGVTGIHSDSADSAALAVEIARRLAGELARVVLVDACQNPAMVSGLMPKSPGVGSLSDFASGRLPLSSVIGREPSSGLHWVEGSSGGPGERLSSMLQALSSAYDAVVLHLGPYAGAQPAALMACEAIAVTGPMMDALEARRVMEALRQVGVAHTEFAASSAAGTGAARPRAA